jgi:hypothetical protein
MFQDIQHKVSKEDGEAGSILGGLSLQISKYAAQSIVIQLFTNLKLSDKWITIITISSPDKRDGMDSHARFSYLDGRTCPRNGPMR